MWRMEHIHKSYESAIPHSFQEFTNSNKAQILLLRDGFRCRIHGLRKLLMLCTKYHTRECHGHGWNMSTNSWAAFRPKCSFNHRRALDTKSHSSKKGDKRRKVKGNISVHCNCASWGARDCGTTWIHHPAWKDTTTTGDIASNRDRFIIVQQQLRFACSDWRPWTPCESAHYCRIQIKSIKIWVGMVDNLNRLHTKTSTLLSICSSVYSL